MLQAELYIEIIVQISAVIFIEKCILTTSTKVKPYFIMQSLSLYLQVKRVAARVALGIEATSFCFFLLKKQKIQHKARFALAKTP